ncbi:uncharacterized protein PG998_013038 [Apiospora kogelbergensis]|uniref:uncharacterized protein n=1 Tax=Apiospora kogelbergensis TaxID=1337665 RepID=UPI00312E3435
MADKSAALADARARVEKVREDIGFPKQKIWETLDAVQREEWTRIIRIKDSINAASIKTLAKNLYTSKTRFVFELLQNAEDNQYERARDRGEAPYVSFHVYPHKIVQECNEDGFTEANLKAICAVGQSSKHGNQGYVGEKGIGFKSVFMAAYRVHIQSRGLSFSFQHRTSDTGLGMITPEWQDPEYDLDEHLSRITLLVHDEGDADELSRQRARIHAQFEEIHDTILLFLKKLDKIVVVFHDDAQDEAKVTKSITFTIDRSEADCRVLTKRTSEDGKTNEDINYYHITQTLVNGLAGNENRIYTETEHADRAYATSEVTLAFPLTKDHVPVLRDEWVFAFLPVQKTRYKVRTRFVYIQHKITGLTFLTQFLIQADFVTQANRQGIVVDSPRNEGLRCGIADAFIMAIKQMCKHPTLRFQWMRYLPSPDDSIDSYWSELIQQISQKVQDARVMVPRSSQTLKLIKDSRVPDFRMLDSSGEPLLRDIEPQVYLSTAYRRADLELLSTFGLRYLNLGEMVDRAKWDLAQMDSRIKTMEDQDWQSRIAILIGLAFNCGSVDLQSEVRALTLLPLRTGQWRASGLTFQQPVYYPKVAGIDLEIPGKVKLDVVCPASTNNEDRKKLFDMIGVKSASVEIVRIAIMKLYQGSFRLTAFQSACHLHFLYLTHRQEMTPPDYSSIKILSDKPRFIFPRRHDDLYVRDETPYGPNQIFNVASPENLSSSDPKFEVMYIHGNYLKDMPSPLNGDKESFKDWLHRHFNVHRYIPIADAAGKKLSDACRYISAHRPERFLGFLKETWADEVSRFDRNGDILRELRKVPVLCERGEKTSMHALGDSYLPLDTLRALCNRFLADEFFPFLKLDTPLSDEVLPLEWKELDNIFHLGVKDIDLVDFAMSILNTIRFCNRDPSSLESPKRILDLYRFLQGKVLESGTEEETGAKIRQVQSALLSYFDRGVDYIYIPQNGSRPARWASPAGCVWQAPTGSKTITRNSLSHLYPRSEATQLDRFFLDTLQIQRKCTWQNIMGEIKALKSVDATDLDVVYSLYKFLHSIKWGPISVGMLREAFAQEKLIYGNELGKWYNTTECLWSSPTKIRTMLVLQPLYEDLQEFFVDFLGVETQTAKMVYEKLTSEETTRLPMEEIKDTILAFSSLLASGDEAYDPNSVLQNKVFPVRCPGSDEPVLQNGRDGFAIWDRKPIGDAFSNQAKFLDFSMDLVRDLERFIKWAGLENRYLSKAVKDLSAVDFDSARVVTSPRLLVQSKAHALVRIAVTYNSPRVGSANNQEALYRHLRQSETLETNKITSELHLYQDGRILKVEKETALLHIREADDGLKIYVPEDEVNQETCFRSKLPLRLCEWLITDPDTQIFDPVPLQAVMVVQSVLGARHGSLRAIMDEQGILDIDLPDEDEDGDGEGSVFDETATLASRGLVHNAHYGELSPSRTLTNGTNDTGTVTPSSSNSPPSRSSSQGRREIVAHSASNDVVSVSRVAASPTPIPIPAQPSRSGYTRLLIRTVAQAREAVFPGPTDSLGLPVRLQGDVIASDLNSLQAFGKLERDRMVGAAGELFVFELLSRLATPALPQFSVNNNWKSTIRHYAAEHPEYGDIRPFIGPETSDITYDDTDGVLTRLLVEKGYMPVHIGSEERIGYSIEVKTTTDVCGAPFYMSNAQYLLLNWCADTHGPGALETNWHAGI